MAEKPMYSIQNETLLVGSFYKDPDLYVEYGTLMRPKYDFYRTEDEESKDMDGEMQFWYNNFENMYRNFSQEFSEQKVNVYMSQDERRFKRYKRLGGYDTISQMKSLADTNDFKSYYNIVKKYSLIRELFRSGFPVQKIMSHKNFDSFDADFIQKRMVAKLHQIKTVTGGGEESHRLGSDAKSIIAGWTKKPSYGIPFPWEKWSESFRGWRKKKFIVEGMLSNEGKSRKMVALATYTSIEQGESVLIMTNEMSKEDIEACKIVTVINTPCYQKHFDFKLDKTENEIVMGLYRDSSGNFLIREFDEYDEPIMKDEQWEDFLYKNSEEYRNVMKVAEWIEENSKMYFREMNGKYSDLDLEMEIKRHVLGKGVGFFFYDTLKGYKSDGWETIKQTATRLEEICKEMNIGGYANYQLTDDSVYVDIFDFNSMNLSSCKHLYHVLDFLCLDKRIYKDEYENYILMDEYGGEVPLDMTKVYYGTKFAKSRTGNKGKVTLVEVDLDRNQWIERGWLKRKGRAEGSSMKKFRY